MLLIHHWDTDGICSAAIIIKESGRNIDNMTPLIGNYFLTEGEKEKCSKYDEICIADIALPEDDIIFLSKRADVTVFDHHLCKYIERIRHVNPVSLGKKQEDFPSTTWVLREYFRREVDLLTVLGIVGDNEHQIKRNRRFMEIIKKFCMREKISFDDLLRSCHLIDSNYKLNRREDVEKIPWMMLDMSVNDILEHEIWNRNLSILEKEIADIISNEDGKEMRRGTIVVNINTKYNIISTVTRRIAWATDKDTVVVNRGMEDIDQVYVRSSKMDLSKLIDSLVKDGYRAGGKSNVAGIVVKKEDTDKIVETILNFLGGDQW